MSNIIDLEIAVLDQDTGAVRSILDELDRRTESALFQRAAEHFGFRTVEHRGRRLAMRTEIARVMGYKDESGIRKLCDRYDLESVPVGAFGNDVRKLVQDQLGIHKFAGRTTFVGWDTFLVAGMQATTEQAAKVKRYLLATERAARVGGALFDIKSREPARLARTEKVVSMLARADRMKNGHLRARALQQIDELMDGALNLGEQQDLLFDTPKK